MTATGGAQVRTRDNALDTARGVAHRRYSAMTAVPPRRTLTAPEYAARVVAILEEAVDDSVIERWRLNRVEIPKHERTE